MDRVNSVFGALIFWFVSACFVIAWVDPQRLWDGRWVSYGVHLFVLEFLVIHSGAFLAAVHLVQKGSKSKKMRWGLPLAWTAVYLLLALPFILSTKSSALLYGFLGVFLPRALSLFRGLDDYSAGHILFQSVVSLLLYIGLAFVTVIFTFPALGLNETVLEGLSISRTGGKWNEHPQNALFAGTAYFFLLGALEWYLAFWNPKKNRPINENRDH